MKTSCVDIENMNVELKPASDADRIIVNNLWNYYLYDMSEYTRWPVSDEGSYVSLEPPLDDYWGRDDHHPFLIYCNDELAGFSLLRKYPGEAELNDIGQFFVLRKFKGLGLGRQAFRLSVSKYPGKWLTRVLEANEGALEFWTSVIGELTSGVYADEIEMYGKHRMHFFRYET